MTCNFDGISTYTRSDVGIQLSHFSMNKIEYIPIIYNNTGFVIMSYK